MTSHFHIHVEPQPDDTTCGPTCLHAVYRYWADDIALADVVDDIPSLPTGGTLGVTLASHALRRGYDVTLLTYNLNLFDPTWFGPRPADLSDKLFLQAAKKRHDEKLQLATEAYRGFLDLGGTVRYQPLTEAMVGAWLDDGVPLLCGLNATYLYDCARERHDQYDDVGGDPTGHFVVLTGWDQSAHLASVADPLHDNPGSGMSQYQVPIERFTASLLLGVMTWDANLVAIQPKSRPRA